MSKINRCHELLIRFTKDNSLGYCPSTLELYQQNIQRFFNSCLDVEYIEDIKKQHVKGWIFSMVNKDLKPRTIRLGINALRSFFSYCKDEEIISINPTLSIDPPTIEKTLPTFIDEQSIFRLREALKGNLRDRAIFEVMYCTGVRVAELVNMKRVDVKDDEKRIDIPDSKGLKERFVLYTEDCSHRLRQYLSTRNDSSPFLFVTRRNENFTTEGIRMILRKYSLQSGIRKITPHDLRRTFATTLYKKNVPIEYISQLMGHERIATTLIYTNLSPNKQ